MARQDRHFGDGLIEKDGCGIVIEGAVLDRGKDLAAAHRPADGDRKEILEGSAHLDAHEIGGGPRMVEVGCQLRAEAFGKSYAARGYNNSCLARDGQFAGNARAANRSYVECYVRTLFYFGRNMIRQCIE